LVRIYVTSETVRTKAAIGHKDPTIKSAELYIPEPSGDKQLKNGQNAIFEAGRIDADQRRFIDIVLSTREIPIVSKAFIAEVIKNSAEISASAANIVAADLIAAIVKEMKQKGGFTLPNFGTFTVKKTKARIALNPRTGEPVKVKAGKTVRFKASPHLRESV